MYAVLFLISTLLMEVRSVNEEEIVGYYYSNDTYSETVLIWGALFLINCVMKTLLIKYKVPFHYTCFAILVGIFAGVIFSKKDRLEPIEHTALTDPLYYLYFYVPGILYKTAFCLDIYVFKKSLLQILIISIPISILTGVMLGFMMRIMIAPQWSYSLALLFGILATPIYAAQTLRYLKELAAHMKHTSSLLDGEAALAVINCFLAYYLYLGADIGFLLYWYQYVIASLRLVLFGSLIGYLSGVFGQFVMKKIYTSQSCVMTFSFGYPFFVFGLTELYFGACGALSVLILGMIMANERSSLSNETDQLLNNMWGVVEVLLNSVICMSCGILLSRFMSNLSWRNYIYGCVIYIVYYLVRFFSFLLFAPILGRIGYGMNLKTMLICVLGGLKSPFCFIFALAICSKSTRVSEHEEMRFGFTMITFYLISYLINGILTPLFLKLMGVSQISRVKQINMNSCMKHVFMKRDKIINVLKMNRYLSDANWEVVRETTVMSHPSDKEALEEDETDDDFSIGYRYTYCVDCKKEVTEEPTKKELQEMTKEAKLRVLKAKKMAYIRQYENGMISKNSLRVLLQAVDLAVDSKDGVIEINQLEKRFKTESWFKRCIRKRVENLSQNKEDMIKRPKTYWRRLCYKLIKRPAYKIFILTIILLNSVVIIVDLVYEIFYEEGIEADKSKKHIAFDNFLFGADFIFFSIYVLEFLIKIFAYSRDGICRGGIPNYFSSHFNKVDFCVILMFVITLLSEHFEEELFAVLGDPTAMHVLHMVSDAGKLLRLVRLLTLCTACYSKLIKYLDSGLDANMEFTYELGKAYATGEEEVVKMIPKMVDHEKIQDELKQRMEYDRVLITKLLGMVQKERPWIAITVKTKQAIRTIINSMKDAVTQLKTSGWTDSYENRKLMIGIQDMYSHANAIKQVQPSSPDVIFEEVAWMVHDRTVFEFLFENIIVRNFEPGEVVFDEGTVADGIYVVVTGLFLLTYTPEEYFLMSLTNFGILPIADYVSNTQYFENVSEYIVSGNCMGELSVLTGRSYNCKITADAHSQVYVLSNGILKRAMELSPDFINGLECRIWKDVSVRIAVPLLMAIPTYHSYSMDQLKYTLERAFMPNLKYYKIFTITDMIQDILLIEGVARDFHSRELYLAPCYIPRTVQKLILPASSMINIPINLETRLLIIPGSGIDEFDVMFVAEETCEMVVAPTDLKCLQHTVHSKSSRMRRRQRDSMTHGSGTRRRHERASVADVSRKYSSVSEAANRRSSEVPSESSDVEENEMESFRNEGRKSRRESDNK